MDRLRQITAKKLRLLILPLGGVANRSTSVKYLVSMSLIISPLLRKSPVVSPLLVKGKEQKKKTKTKKNKKKKRGEKRSEKNTVRRRVPSPQSRSKCAQLFSFWVYSGFHSTQHINRLTPGNETITFLELTFLDLFIKV